MTPRDKTPIKQKSVEKLSELKEEYDLCDIWRIRNPTNSDGKTPRSKFGWKNSKKQESCTIEKTFGLMTVASCSKLMTKSKFSMIKNLFF